MSLKDQPTFPTQKPDMSHAGDTAGMTLRQHYAGLAMQALLGSSLLNTKNPDQVAEAAIQAADALIAELEKNT